MRTWNRTLRNIADEHIHHIARSSRLFALANLAAADAFIAVWDGKYHYNFWRPVTAIREGQNDGNPNTEGNTTWTPPFITTFTPQYPDYTSGANAVTTVPGNLSRDYTRFSDVMRDIVDVRVLQGISLPLC